MRRISSTTRVFYNLQSGGAPVELTAHEKGGALAPRLFSSSVSRGYSRLSAIKYSSVSSEVSAAAMYVKAAAERTRLVPFASPRERIP